MAEAGWGRRQTAEGRGGAAFPLHPQPSVDPHVTARENGGCFLQI